MVDTVDDMLASSNQHQHQAVHIDADRDGYLLPASASTDNEENVDTAPQRLHSGAIGNNYHTDNAKRLTNPNFLPVHARTKAKGNQVAPAQDGGALATSYYDVNAVVEKTDQAQMYAVSLRDTDTSSAAVITSVAELKPDAKHEPVIGSWVDNRQRGETGNGASPATTTSPRDADTRQSQHENFQAFVRTNGSQAGDGADPDPATYVDVDHQQQDIALYGVTQASNLATTSFGSFSANWLTGFLV